MADVVDRCNSPVEKVFYWAGQRPTATFLRQPQLDGSIRCYTWLEVAREVASAATGLKQLGLAKRDCVAILGGNSAHWLMADLAIQLAGCTSVPIYTSMSADGVGHVLDTCRPKAFVLGAAANWAAVAARFAPECTRIGLPDAPAGACDHGWRDLTSRATDTRSMVFPELADWYTILQTSGSTGVPKGVVQTFRSSAVSSRDWAVAYGMNESDRFMSYLPLAHAGERTLVIGGCIHGGGTLYFSGSPADFLNDLRAVRPTFLLGVPRIWEKLRQAAVGKFELRDFTTDDTSTMRQVLEWLGLDGLETAITGGAPMPPVLNRWYRKLGLEILEAYASSEVASAIVSTRAHHRDGSVGRALPNVQVRIADDGEILIRSESCMLGYLDQPDATREAFAGGWMHTGDLGAMDDDGYVFITGRLKDIYKTAKGKYVAPLPIEHKFAGNGLLEQVCLVGEGLPQPVLVAQPSAIARAADPAELSDRLGRLLDEVNGSLQAHERIRFILVAGCDWNETNGLCTHSLKLRRKNIEAAYSTLIADLYAESERDGSKVRWQQSPGTG